VWCWAEHDSAEAFNIEQYAPMAILDGNSVCLRHLMERMPK
jgi:hypothetical protein